MSTQARLRSLQGQGEFSRVALAGQQVVNLQIPALWAEQDQTGSSSPPSLPLSQMFQRPGDLLGKLNADIREWDNWIQVG